MKFRSNFIEIKWRTVEIWGNIRSFWQKTEIEIFTKIWNWAVQRNINFVGLEKCCKMSIYLQRSVLIQRRTSDLIFIILAASRDIISTERSSRGPTAARGRPHLLGPGRLARGEALPLDRRRTPPWAREVREEIVTIKLLASLHSFLSRQNPSIL